jgi:hypothetical protein
MRGRHPNQAAEPAGPPVLVAGRLIGVRRWELVVDDAGALRLRGSWGGVWQIDGKTTWAQCRRRGADATARQHRDSAPAGSCCCGLYALHPWKVVGDHHLAPGPGDSGLAVHGVIEAWGEVQLHHEGFRAQYARPRYLVVFGSGESTDYGRLVAQLADSHHAELLEVADPEALVAYCRRRELGLGRSTVRSLLGGEDGRR